MKKAIIIGASSGIGKELARLFVKNGYKVGITARRTHLLETLKQENPNAFEVLQMDVCDLQMLAGKLDQFQKSLGGIDVLVISSGTGELNPSLDYEVEQNTINTNVSGFTLICNWAFHYFLKQNAGHLVAISSIAGIRGSRIAPAYNASKAFQINYLEGLKQKVHKNNLQFTITDIRPGFVDTAMAKGNGKFWVASPEKAAMQIFNAIQRKEKTAYITKRWALFALLLRLIPARVYNKM